MRKVFLRKTKLSLVDETKVISLPNRKNNWVNYSGWAASILIGSTLIWSINKNNALKNQLIRERQQMELQIDKSSNTVLFNPVAFGETGPKKHIFPSLAII